MLHQIGPKNQRIKELSFNAISVQFRKFFFVTSSQIFQNKERGVQYSFSKTTLQRFASKLKKDSK